MPLLEGDAEGLELSAQRGRCKTERLERLAGVVAIQQQSFAAGDGAGKQCAMELSVLGAEALGQQHLLLQILAHPAEVKPRYNAGHEGVPPRLNFALQYIGEPSSHPPAFFRS